MSTSDVFRRIVAKLDRAGVRYMLTGSFAGAYHGSPRATQDIDLVIDADEAQVRAFVQSLPSAEHYADESAALEAFRDKTQFSVIDLATGWKIDLIVRKSRPFSVEEFGRRRAVDFDGTTLSVATPEDLIIAKLEWAHHGESTRQVEDVAAILKLRVADLDAAYLRRWVAELGLGPEWITARARAGLGRPPELVFRGLRLRSARRYQPRER